MFFKSIFCNFNFKIESGICDFPLFLPKADALFFGHVETFCLQVQVVAISCSLVLNCRCRYLNSDIIHIEKVNNSLKKQDIKNSIYCQNCLLLII